MEKFKKSTMAAFVEEDDGRPSAEKRTRAVHEKYGSLLRKSDILRDARFNWGKW